MKKILLTLAASSLVLVAGLLLTIKLIYGGGEAFPDRSSEPTFGAQHLEVVTELAMPPGNIAVTAQGRLFFTFHPEAKPNINVVELVGNVPRPFPSLEWQPGGSESLAFQEILSIRVDRQNRLWLLDNAVHGLGQPRLLAFDIDSKELVHHFDFPSDIFGLGSHANDFQVDPTGRYIYMADASIIARTPAIVIYDTQTKQVRRVLESHVSVMPEFFIPVVNERPMEIFGIFTVSPGVDSIALSRDGTQLFYAAVTAQKLYKIDTQSLNDATLSADELASRVNSLGEKTMSDGISSDIAGNVYLSDLEHNAILRMNPQGKLETLIKDKRIHWPDGMSFGPDNWLYFTDSALNNVIGKTPQYILDHAPYHIFRFKPGMSAYAGQ